MRSLAIPFDIPDGWVWIHPTDIGYFGSGKTPTPDQLSKFGTVPYFKVADMNAAGNEIVLCNSNSFLKFPDSMKLFSKGAVVYPKNGGAVFTNKKRILGQDSLVDLNTGSYTPFSQMDEQFFFYLFSTVDFQKYYKGTALPTVDMDAVQEIVWALPPLAEQKRIVTAIELSLPLIDKYEETHSQLSRLQNSFPEALKKSILQEAVQGKLVPQDPSDEPAEALLERIRAEKQRLIKEGKIKKDKHESVIFRRDNSHYEKRGSEEVCIDDEIPFEIPENWAWARLSSFGVFSSGKTPSMSNPQFWNGNIPWVTSKDMKRPVITDSEMHISELAASSMQLYPAGTLLLVARSGILKRLLPLCKLGIDSTINQDIKAFSLYDIELSEWLFYGIKAFEPYILKELVKSVTTVESLKFDEFSAILIPVPPPSEQRRIIAAIKTAMNLLTPLSSNPLFSL